MTGVGRNRLVLALFLLLGGGPTSPAQGPESEDPAPAEAPAPEQAGYAQQVYPPQGQPQQGYPQGYPRQGYPPQMGYGPPQGQPMWNVDGSRPLPGVVPAGYHQAVYPGTAMPPCPECAAPAAEVPVVGLLDNFMLFGGLDGAKGPEDLGVNAHFGSRVGFNWGIPVWQAGGLGVQIGVAENFHNNTFRVLKNIEGGTTQRFQTWVTLGLFQRTSVGFNWGAAYDFRFDDYYQSLSTAQVRAQVGWNLSPSDEVGVWGTLRTRDDDVLIADAELQIRPMNQLAFFWRHVWTNNVVTRGWVGFADGHGRYVLGEPPESRVNSPFLFGGDVFVPLNDWLALWGEANFITPNDTGTVTAFLGFAITPGSSNLFGRSRFAPYLPTANNMSFSLDARGP